MLKKTQVFFTILWLSLILTGITTVIIKPEVATPEFIASVIRRFSGEMMLIYVLMNLGRGLFFIPTTPIVLGGAIMFPDQLFLVLFFSMVGVVFWATAMYFFADYLGFSEYFERKYPKGVRLWKSRLERPGSALFVLGWAFFPLVPTDLICYAAGIVKMPYKYMILGVFIGQLTLNALYVFLGAGITELIL